MTLDRILSKAPEASLFEPYRNKWVSIRLPHDSWCGYLADVDEARDIILLSPYLDSTRYSSNLPPRLFIQKDVPLTIAFSKTVPLVIMSVHEQEIERLICSYDEDLEVALRKRHEEHAKYLSPEQASPADTRFA